MLANTSFTILKTKRIIDSQGKVYGNVGDVVLDKHSLQLMAFVIRGSKLEEALERFKIRKEHDPVLLPDQIERVTTEAIFLSVSFDGLDHLDHYLRNGKKPVALFSELKEEKIFDKNGNHIAHIVDLHFPRLINGSSQIEYELGGASFVDLLKRNHCSPQLTYTISVHDLTYDMVRGYIVDPSAREMQDKIKTSLRNIHRDMLTLALRDGELLGEEQAILQVVQNQMAAYYALVEQENGDSLLRQEEIKEQILQKLIAVAKKNQIISKDERQLILKFAGHLLDHSREMFYTKQVL